MGTIQQKLHPIRQQTAPALQNVDSQIGGILSLLVALVHSTPIVRRWHVTYGRVYVHLNINKTKNINIKHQVFWSS
jgi:hypothetical protein